MPRYDSGSDDDDDRRYGRRGGSSSSGGSSSMMGGSLNSRERERDLALRERDRARAELEREAREREEASAERERALSGDGSSGSGSSSGRAGRSSAGDRRGGSSRDSRDSRGSRDDRDGRGDRESRDRHNHSGSSSGDRSNTAPPAPNGGFVFEQLAPAKAGSARPLANAAENKAQLRSIIVRIGEKSSRSIEYNLHRITLLLASDLSVRELREHIVRTLISCISELPEKTTIYSTLAGLLCSLDITLIPELIERCCERLQFCLEHSLHRHAKLTVRFLADLVNVRVVQPSSLLVLLDSFLAVTNEPQVTQRRADYYVFLVLSALPWAGPFLNVSRPNEFARLIAFCETFIQRRRESELFVDAIRVWTSVDGLPQEEYLISLWNQIVNLRATNWDESVILRPYMTFSEQLDHCVPSPLTPITVPAHSLASSYPLPQVIFRLFTAEDTPEPPVLPAADSIDRFTFGDMIQDLVFFYEPNRKECLRSLSQIPAGQYPVDHMIIESLFADLFALPNPPHREVYYSTLLIEYTRDSRTLDEVLQQAIQRIYERLEFMDVACVNRFCEWFAMYLNNGGFQWDWNRWSEILTLDPLHPKVIFFNETLLRVRRLSFHERLIKMLPEDFHSLLPAPPLPSYPFEETEATQDASVAKALVTSYLNKESKANVLNVLNMVEESSNPELTLAQARFRLFLFSLLQAGSKSLSHISTLLERYIEAFDDFTQMYGGDDSAAESLRFDTIKILTEFWKDNEQMLIILIDKLITLRLLTPSTVVEWLFLSENVVNFHRFYYWEIVINSLSKLQFKSQQARQAYNKARLDLDDTMRKRNEERALLNEQLQELTGMGSTLSDSATMVVSKLQTRLRGIMSEESQEDERLQALESHLDTVQTDFRAVFLQLFTRFQVVISDHLSNARQNDTAYNTPWFHHTVARLLDVGRKYHEEISAFAERLRMLVFTDDVDERVRDIFNQLRSLHE
ncbi:hypothetical protein CAOG_07112 [Capsaspora owczarzaki ATCC 30864]|uniref:MIF4G domain-containing protein n=1 Tax=Capsaspora owczarzaki (strain ATCC 30864) TaxID=595528 RepID=A0A0D2UPB5_CAPO3|nr:hypothetical protein CAOG_07112 [Capsaspora owczarzaki ATCC 30864]KJE96851.1 hypothetical protein CAOG_007112 [Capsaspora owczarzaki ATCC 30864]|eukprot:XP_004343836.1 hypothetical protein CAOG_07112 [Capsaspora owczarzaki ATCC 30864]